eukprot:5076513-Pyramimonas_sp.AAC.1
MQFFEPDRYARVLVPGQQNSRRCARGAVEPRPRDDSSLQLEHDCSAAAISRSRGLAAISKSA